MDYNYILEQLPYQKPFLFVDDLTTVDKDGVEGCYTFGEDAYFYKGHFKDRPVTPGVILTECCAQIGLVCLGIYVLGLENQNLDKDLKITMTSTDMEFYLPVFPNEKVRVTAKKVYYRFQKLKCEVKMHNTIGDLVCKGFLAGMFKNGQF